MSVVVLPPPADISAEAKKTIIEGLKKVLARFQQAALMDQSLTYQHLINDPNHLEQFITTFTGFRERVDDLVQAKDGSGPVRDDDLTLVCGVSLNQIQQLLVRTCAKKVYDSEKTVQTVTETVTRTALFGLIKKTEEVEVQRLGDPVEERKLRELTRFLAFGWQLPLLQAYKRLNYPQIMEMGDDLLSLRTPDHVVAVSKFDGQLLRKVKQASGRDFTEILLQRPQAIGGVAVWNHDMYEFFHSLLGSKAWDFFARDQQFFNVVASVDKPTARVYGDVLCYIATDGLEELQRLNIDKLEVMVQSLTEAFGADMPQILGQPNFAKEFLRKVVDNLLHMGHDKDKLIMSFSLTFKSMLPAVKEWLAKQ